MSQCTDPASVVVDTVIAALRAYFSPNTECPPDGGGTEAVRFLVGDRQSLPVGVLPSCPEGDSILVWVRLDRRYEAKLSEFPSATVRDQPCQADDIVPTIALEVGVGRCVSMEAQPDWETLAREAEIALDDSWRISLALDLARCQLQSRERAVAIDTVAPDGPAAGVMLWTGMAYVQLT